MLENLRTVYSRYYLEQEDLQTVLLVDDGINRPHAPLSGFTPYEVFSGAKPDKTQFNDQIELAKIRRKAENKALTCNNCAFTLANQD